MADLDELRRTVLSDPAEACRELSAVVSGPAATHDRCVGWSLLGRARLSLGEVELAETAGRRSLADAEDLQSGPLIADAHLVLASVCCFGRRYDDAQVHLDEVDRVGTETQKVQAVLQRAAIAQRCGMAEAARELYTSVLPVVEHSGSPLDRANVLANLGLIDVQAGRIDAGIDQLERARSLFEAEGHEFAAAQMLHNLGWGHGRRGDVVSGLRCMASASQQFARLGAVPEEVELDRADLLLSAGLWVDAVELAERSAQRCAAAGNAAGAAEAWLVCAAASRLAGDGEATRRCTEMAHAGFTAIGNPAGAALARLEVARLAFTRRLAIDVDPAEARSIEAELAASAQALGATVAGALVAVLEGRKGNELEAVAAAERCRRWAGELGTVVGDVLIELAQAAASVAARAPDRALSAARRGVARLREEQAQLLSVQDAGQLASLFTGLAELGVTAAVMMGRADAAAEAADWLCSGAVAVRRPTVAADPAIARLADRIRALGADIRRRQLDGEGVAGELERRRALERELRMALLATERDGPGMSRPPKPGGPARWDGSLLHLVPVDGWVLAVVTSSEGSTSMQRLGSVEDLETAAIAAARTLRSLAGSQRGAGHRVRQLEAALAAWDRCLGSLPDLPDPIRIAVPGHWMGLPWHLLARWRHRSVALCPSAHWLAGATGFVSPRRVAVISGPRLRFAELEAAGVAEVFAGCSTERLQVPSVRRALDAIGAADLAHVVAHGSFRSDNPQWSSLELADGPLMAHDLERLAECPRTVILSACDTVAPSTGGRSELLGVAASLLAGGASNVVCSAGPLPDAEATVDTMVELERRLCDGVFPSAAVSALRQEAWQQLGSSERFPAALYLVVVGSG